MTALARRNPWESLLVAIAFVALAAALYVPSLGADVRDTLDRAERQLQVIQDEFAQFDVPAMEAEIERLRSEPPANVPSRIDAEAALSVVASIVSTAPGITLGPIVQSESVRTVRSLDIGLDDGPEDRTYESIDLAMVVDGSPTALVDLLTELTASVPLATIQEVLLDRVGGADIFRLDMIINLFHAP